MTVFLPVGILGAVAALAGFFLAIRERRAHRAVGRASGAQQHVHNRKEDYARAAQA